MWLWRCAPTVRRAAALMTDCRRPGRGISDVCRPSGLSSGIGMPLKAETHGPACRAESWRAVMSAVKNGDCQHDTTLSAVKVTRQPSRKSSACSYC